MIKTDMITKMIDFSQGNHRDIEHFLKVYAYAVQLANMEQVDERTMQIIEYTTIVHDISCPYCREKYGNCNGSYQELESEAILRPFLAEFDLPADILERVIYLVCHHHTYTNIEGIDYQILVEADYLVNAYESQFERKNIEAFGKNVFKTESGKRLLESMFLR